jgi:hypothetical protein
MHSLETASKTGMAFLYFETQTSGAGPSMQDVDIDADAQPREWFDPWRSTGAAWDKADEPPLALYTRTNRKEHLI